MKKYEVYREIYNPCSKTYIFDNNFFHEIETDNTDLTLKNWIYGDMPKYEKNILSDGSVEYILYLPRKERYTFSII